MLCRSPKPKSNPEQPVSIDLTVDDSPEQPSVMNGDESSYSLSQYNLEQNQRLLLWRKNKLISGQNIKIWATGRIRILIAISAKENDSTEQIIDITSYSPLNMVIKLQYKIQHDMAVPEKLNINFIGLMKLNIQIFLYLKMLRSH